MLLKSHGENPPVFLFFFGFFTAYEFVGWDLFQQFTQWKNPFVYLLELIVGRNSINGRIQ